MKFIGGTLIVMFVLLAFSLNASENKKSARYNYASVTFEDEFVKLPDGKYHVKNQFGLTYYNVYAVVSNELIIAFICEDKNYLLAYSCTEECLVWYDEPAYCGHGIIWW